MSFCGAGRRVARRSAPRRCGRRAASPARRAARCGVTRYLSSVGSVSVQPERPAARDDRHLVDRVGVGQHVADERVAALVVGDDRASRARRSPGSCARARRSTRSIASSSCGMPICLRSCAGREQRGLVHQVGEVGAGEAGRAPGQHVEVDAGRERLALGVHLEDRLAALEVGAVDDDLAVEAAGPQQRRVEDVGPVGGGDAGSRRSSASKPSISTSSWLSVCSRSS